MFARYRFPMAPFADLHREVERLFDGFGPGFMRLPHRRAGLFPALNVWDQGESLCVEAELPGLNQDSLEIYAIGNELTIKGRRAPMEGRDLAYHRQERGTGEFSRVIALPAEVDPDKIEAVLKDGVLTLRLPKAESAKPRKIALKTG